MSNQSNIITDLSTLTRIPNKTLGELSHKATLCIGNIIAEAKAKGEQAVIINIGIGTLSIDLITMQSKFIPSKDLKMTIKHGVTVGIDPLECALEQALVEKLIHFCDEVL
jgi:hypothetical protein